MSTALTLIKSSLPFLYLRPATRNTIQAFHIAAFVVQVVNGAPWKGGHPEFSLVARVFESLRNAREACLLHQRKIQVLNNIVLIVNSHLLFCSATTP